MKKKRLLVVATFATSLVFVCALATGAAAQGQGGGSGKKGGGGTSTDYGDLFILYRGTDGVPILTPDGCQQPLAAPGVSLPAVGDFPACIPASWTESCVIPVDPAICTIVPGYEAYAQEVDFGRTSVIRSPVSVLQQQMDDVVVNLATADCITLDAAGRLVTSRVTGDIVSSTEIDSPLQNLAIYWQLMLTGYLGTATAPLPLPDEALITAARGLGAASDKFGNVTVDMVAYINQFLGLTDETVDTFLPKKCITVKEEVLGVVQTVRKCFLDYGAFDYGRAANFDSLPAPPYIPASGPLPGWFEYLAVADPTVPTFYVAEGLITSAVPELAANQAWTGSDIGGFAQAVDDARAVIEFMHTWPVPGAAATPLSCTPSGTTNYDVSISSVSGLQVPPRMVAGTEGREFTLTVANAGPEAATGVATVTATDATGALLPSFPRSFPFVILAGASESWTELFSITYSTTITWTATATAEFDVNPVNNSVTETTRVTGRGRR